MAIDTVASVFSRLLHSTMVVRKALKIALPAIFLLHLHMGRMIWMIQRDLPNDLTMTKQPSLVRSTITIGSNVTLSTSTTSNNLHPERFQVKCGRGSKTCGEDFSMPEKIHDGPSTRQQQGLPGKVLFHHIHKCGGTSVCAMAKMNGEITPVIHDRRDPTCFVPPPHHCMTFVEEFVPSNSNVTFVEYPCPRQGDADWQNLNNVTKAWQFVTFLRHPLERILSQYRHFGYLSAKSNFTAQEQVRNDLDAFADYAKTRTNEILNWLAPGWREVERQANKTSGGNATLTENAILDFAKWKMQEYDILVVLEDMSLDCPRFAQAMGWNVTAACSVHRNADAARGYSDTNERDAVENLSTPWFLNKK